MSRLANCVLAASLVLTSIGIARSQTASPGDRAKNAQQEIHQLIACTAYWEIQSQCLSLENLQRKEQARRLFDQLLSSASTFTEWLGDRAQMPHDVQQQLRGQTKDRLFSSIGGKCANAFNLVPAYRDKCAALIIGITAQIKDDFERKKKDALSDAQSVKDVEMDCTGTLEENLADNVPISKERKATAHVNIISGGIVMATIKPDGIPGGMVTGQIIGVKPNYLRYDVLQSTFTIGRSEPKLVGVDRVNAEVAIFLRGEKDYTFWFKCKVRKPQF